MGDLRAEHVATAPTSMDRGSIGAMPSTAVPIANAGDETTGPAVPSKLDTAVLRTQAKQALVGMGWKATIAESSVSAALAALGPAAPLERLIFEALRRCPRPSA